MRILTLNPTQLGCETILVCSVLRSRVLATTSISEFCVSYNFGFYG